ncbi:CARDB domain-containing protein [Runella zeae]|uniref:CARDB domain-containing protein n=1 Tax=Runella zeae TaxID=94255 RepID=UPI00041FFFE9|nr:CARDB domain-containing protein [Runella zeae]
MKTLYPSFVVASLSIVFISGCITLQEKLGPSLSISGNTDYGEIWQGDTVTKTLVIKNRGDATATGINLQIPMGYVSTTGTTLSDLAAKDSVTFQVSFIPPASGTYNNDLVVKYNNNTDLATRALTGKAWGKIWDKVFGGNNSDGVITIIPSVDGGYLIGGYSYSGISGDKTQTAKGESDYWVVKINANGDKEWDKTYGGDQHDILTSIIATSDGGFILGGYSHSSASTDKSENSKGDNGSSDYWIVKINSNGDKQWDKVLGGYSFDNLRSIIPTSDGGYLLGGDSSSGIGADKTEASKGSTDFWVLKINANGIKVWDKTYGGDRPDQIYRMITTADGGFLLTGTSASGVGGDKTQPSIGEEDIWIVKINASGNKQWDKVFGGNKSEYISSIISSSDGNYILGATSSSSNSRDKTQPSRGENDFWTLKITPNGDKIWDKTWGGNSFENLTSVAPIGNEDWFVAGSSNSTLSGDRTRLARANPDFWILKITANGEKKWDKAFGGGSNESLNAIATTADNGFLLAGTSNSNLGNDKSQSSRGSVDFWVIKIK